MRNSSWLVLGVALLVGLPATGWAQAAKAKKAPAPAAPMEIEEITVTAQKREENIQEVPISVTALSGATLAEKGASSFEDLVQSVPALWISRASGGASSTVIAMRGTLNGDPSMVQNPTVGLYLDGVYLAKIQGSNFDLEDLDRVEALRGPQGTLFGRNTTGGAVNFVSKKPTEERSITAATEVGNFDSFKGRVTLNAPLVGTNGFFQSDALGTISLRENVVYRSHDGYFRNQSPTNLPASGGSELSSINRVFSMTALRWQPIKEVTVDYAFEYHRYRQSPSASQLTVVYPENVAANPALGALLPYVRTNRVDATGNNAIQTSAALGPPHGTRPNDDGNNRMHMLTAAWDLGEVGPIGNVVLKSISSYRALTLDNDIDLDGSPLPYANFHLHDNLDHWSEEVQWLGTGARYHYVLGAYYYGEHTTEVSQQVFYGGALDFYFINTAKNSSFAPFGQFTWTPPILNDKLSITAGLRWTADHIHTNRNYQCVNVYSNLCNIGIPSLMSYKASTGRGFGGTDALTPMVNLAYQWTDEIMTYGRVSKGYQSGAVNGRASQIESFRVVEPEKLWSYELGFKTQWWDNRLRFNADGYYSRYSDQVVNTFVASQTGGAVNVLSNAGKSEIWGTEIEAVAIPLRGVELNVNYNLTLPKYLEFIDQGVDIADQRAIGGPRNQLSTGMTYTAPPTSAGVFSAHLDTFWQDETKTSQSSGTSPNDAWAYAVVNGRLQFVDIPLAKGSLDLAVFGRNLFDRKYRVFGVDFGRGASGIGFANNQYGDPRTFGVGLAYHFTAGQEAPAPPAPVAQAAPPPPPPAKKKIVLRSVHFDFDKATLKAEAKPILDEAVQVLKQEGSVDIVVEGHTDSVGTDQYNLGLSRRRAETVRTYLVEHGIARSRITAEGMGESKPVASNDTADGRAQNRRVELHVK
ncbi:MAG: TonB-dependent receptor [Deltaproteobacteria bacterium]|nr:TonB-dependent receptor [Deltaproteobacteria bacterium]